MHLDRCPARMLWMMAGASKVAFADADVFLRINGWRLQRVPTRIHAETMQMFAVRTLDIAHLDPWLRGFARDQAPVARPGEVESLPTFTEPARQRWELIPAHIRQRLLTNVWCGQCRHEVTITDFSGTMKGRELLLVGRCTECGRSVTRVIEGA